MITNQTLHPHHVFFPLGCLKTATSPVQSGRFTDADHCVGIMNQRNFKADLDGTTLTYGCRMQLAQVMTCVRFVAGF